MGDSRSADRAESRLSLSAFPSATTYRERVIDVLRAALISGEMRPGELYSAPAIASRLGVSATPVREAMADMARTGMIEVVRNQGYRVTELSDRELDEIIHVRGLLEVPTVATIAADCDKEAVEQLRPLALEIQEAAATGDLVRYIYADHTFHSELLTLGGNEHLVRVVAELRSRSRMYGLQDLADRGELATSASEHLELLDLIGGHEVARAKKLMDRHIHHVRGVWAGKPETGYDRSSS